MPMTLTPPVGPRDHVLGPADAPVTLVEYGDYECPYCGQANLIVGEIRAAMGGRLRYVFRHFPVTDLHPQAEHAAEAAECAADRGEFWRMHDVLYANQDALDDLSLAAYAHAIGLDRARVLREVTAEAHAARIRADVTSGFESGVAGTPTFFIDGRRYEGAWGVETLLAVLEDAASARI